MDPVLVLLLNTFLKNGTCIYSHHSFSWGLNYCLFGRQEWLLSYYLLISPGKYHLPLLPLTLHGRDQHQILAICYIRNRTREDRTKMQVGGIITMKALEHTAIKEDQSNWSFCVWSRVKGEQGDHSKKYFNRLLGKLETWGKKIINISRITDTEEK